MKERKIYFICPSVSVPFGGIKQIYKYVNILNNHGYNAAVLLKKNKKKANIWYPFTKISYHYELIKNIENSSSSKNHKNSLYEKLKIFFHCFFSPQIEKDALFVFPEIYGKSFHKTIPNHQYVILNQNCYYTFQGYGYDYNEENPYLSKNCMGTIVASENAQKYFDLVFPSHNLYKARLGIDTEVFNFGNKKKRKIAFMPRKLSEDSLQIINIIKARKKLNDWEFFPIDNMDEKEVAQHLKESVFFLSFNHREGFGLPPIEAMSCGCFVIGYSGQGGKEYFKEEFSCLIEEGNIIDFVEKLEHYALEYSTNSDLFFEKGKIASQFVLENYSLENETKDWINIWEKIIS
ncbi:glycosyl transferase group 1 [Chryseobacterium sp. StRB126]|uniref:glycosyltransferase n=1 Tax=Chryseobacterium sp. StRB126 TaxID=878220 RepID=UPI0004E9933D|nr:glycosyltransferase [Chryseobacterium sp. StRB126]BAP33581.1 glycosyl transferase group 1 [Chryseobacterium sp. StRB126]